MRRAKRSVPAFSAGCWGECHGHQHLPAADTVRAVHFAGNGGGIGVRPAAALSDPPPAPDHRTGRAFLPGTEHIGVSIYATPGPGGTAGLCSAGRGGRDCPVFHAFFRPIAPRVGFLVHQHFIFGASSLAAGAGECPAGEKNIYSRKKALLFCRKVLYNNKRQRFSAFPQRRSRLWHKNAAKAKSSAPAPAS